MIEKKKNMNFFQMFVVAVYIASITVTFYSDTNIPKIASMVIIPIAFLMILISPDFEKIKTIGEFPAWILFALGLIYALSICIWLKETEDKIYIFAGTQRIIYQIINVLVAFSSVYVFGSKAIDYALCSAFIMNGIFVVRGLLEYGIVGSFNDLLNTFKTGEQNGFMHITEINVVTYLYGFFIVYYLFISGYSRKTKATIISICAFYMIMGFKRINLASTVVALAVAFLFYILPSKFKKPYVYIVSVIVATVSFLYIPFIRNGYFEYIMNKFEVNTNTRIDLYNFIKSEYEFKPSFSGRGLDFVIRYLAYLKTQHVSYKGASLKYIHNDILAKYIELGFFGFCGWLYSMCIFVVRWLNKHCGIVAAAMYAVMNVNNFINFSVGNTNHAYSVRLVIEIIIIGTVSKILSEQEQTVISEG